MQKRWVGRLIGVGPLQRVMIILLTLAFLGGCASRPINDPLDAVDQASGYRPDVLIRQRENNTLDTLFVLSFSGGGTRAAAFSYGVLEALRDIEVTFDGQPRRMVDEVDVITGVSGGSFTALSYALYGDRLFDDYEARFLKRNVQGDLLKRTLNPFNWGKLWSGNYGRSELAAEYYDEILFENATFADLIGLAPTRPVAIATGTDMAIGTRFAFYQYDFDLICSDLSTLSLSRAAATSSAVPVVLTPVTLSNYGGSCGYEYPPWVEALESLDPHTRPAGRALERYHDMVKFRNSDKRPYLHLVDGGVSDNIGVRGVLDTLEQLALSRQYVSDVGFQTIRRVIVIVVNAHSEKSNDWEQKESPPSSATQLMQASGVPIERFSFETVELMKDRAAVSAMRRELQVAQARLEGMSKEEAEALYPKIDVHVMEVSFERVPHPGLRQQLMNMPTSFVLPPADVDRLRRGAGEALRALPGFISLVQAYGDGTAE